MEEPKRESRFYPNFDNTVWVRSCEQEVNEPVTGEISGEVPSWLRGTLLRNGPGSFKVGSMKYEHLFDGSALLHRFAIADGGATYQCRFLRSETYKRNQAANRIVVTEFGTQSVPDPCHSIFDRLTARFHPDKMMTDNSLVSVYPMGDEIYAFTESAIIHRIDPVTLDTLDRKNLMYKVIVCHTAHPHVMENGDVYNVGLSVVNLRIQHVVVKFPYTEKGDMFEEAKVVGTMAPRWPLHPAYMHSFGITENYFVIVEQPLAISIPHLVVNQLSNHPISACMKWHPEYETHIVLISRETGIEVKRYVTPTLFYVHIVNTFERDGTLILDLCCYDDAKVLDAMYIEALENLQSNPDYANWGRGRPKRIEMPLEAPNMTWVKAHLITDLGCELPRINYDMCNGKPYRYFYAISSDIDCENPGKLIKVDTKTGDTLIWCEDDSYASEPIFVPAPDAKEEDEGVLLSAVLFGKRECAVALVILDARTMHERARITFTTPSPAPKCLHGWFLPA